LAGRFCSFCSFFIPIELSDCRPRCGLPADMSANDLLYVVLRPSHDLERSILKERIMAGIARARDKGTKSGKPIGRPPHSGQY